jgi:NADP-dependent 3-hydroxy acid dehydrogenase YdfG
LIPSSANETCFHVVIPGASSGCGKAIAGFQRKAGLAVNGRASIKAPKALKR